MHDIEERLKARAGNPPLKDSYYTVKKGELNKSSNSTPPSRDKMGNGISEDEVKRIISEFKID